MTAGRRTELMDGMKTILGVTAAACQEMEVMEEMRRVRTQHPLAAVMTSNHTFQKPECPSFNFAAFAIVYFLMFPVALLLNGVAAWVSLRLRSNSTLIVYVKHLVAADLIMAFTIPPRTATTLPGSPLTLYILVCRYFSVIFYTTMYICITFLGLISLDRFFKIVRPQSKFFGQNLIFSKLVSVCVWLVFIGTSIPTIALSHESASNGTKISSCVDLKHPDGVHYHKWLVICLNVFFWVVSTIIAACNICIANKVFQSFRKSGSNNNQGKNKIKLRIFMVLIVFGVSFCPYHVVRIHYTFQQVSPTGRCSILTGKFANEISVWLATTNICLNPLLYVFLCREFKEKLVSLVTWSS
ncbi:P2Y purinoceptor 13-like [Genypterus blacodes]|uniref:P2Y purinoceptor 13-like n=1 Tax=Genypterus blacodes TaxID=154954 RepID=UPI003F76128E